MEDEEKMELSHEPVPGYRTVFYIAMAVAVAYLGFIFIRCL
ncbi:hypothetical protein [Desulfonema magnum]|uniref:Uncharacterized protein n=1 Tax=Desulfonema magnum TaxID=45655 RepID=A0A975BWQ4_9BACT|nr:hypothetical protein [Desulfonema magnum]QTA93181.1 Uncharacterized protein dnm_092790 [Desulfonema magnum]